MNMLGLTEGLLENVLSLVAKELNKRPSLRKKLLITFGISGLISITVLIINQYLDLSMKETIFNISTGFVIILSFGFIVVINSFLPNIYNSTSVSERLAELADKRLQIEHKIEEGNNGNVQEIIKLNLNQLDEYYTINKFQSKNSYGFSVFMTIVGFLLIITTVFIFFVDSKKYTISMITGLAGLISEFVGATSLLLYKESTKHLNEFIKRLTYLQKVMLAIDLVEKMPDDKKSEQVSTIITGLMNSD